MIKDTSKSFHFPSLVFIIVDIMDNHFDSVPVSVRVVVHEPGAVVVHIHGPRLFIFPQHHVFHGVDPRHTKRRVRVVVIAIDSDLPVVGALRFKWK